jgi:acyl dehydratase
MAQSRVIDRRIFSSEDQERFAVYSGDLNPMHMDAAAARRTKAGFPVVHGVHTLLWSLDSFTAEQTELPSIAAIKVGFENFIYVGDEVVAHLVQQDAAGARIETTVHGLVAMRLTLRFGPLGPAKPINQLETAPIKPLLPLDLSLIEMADRSGRIPMFSPLDKSAVLFPNAVRLLGIARIAALACSSFLVGMVCPGLHSTYRSLSLAATSESPPLNDLDFRVAGIDERFRMVRMDISGGGWTGSLVTHARPVPTAQLGMAEIMTMVAPNEFADTTSLVIGGSRGLGELTAKILAAGGARVILTYAIGLSDAQRVQRNITDHGGKCDIISYNVKVAADEQLSALPTIPDELYYFATPQIFRQKYLTFNDKLFAEFLIYYVSAFHQLWSALTLRQPNGLSVFYPSSIFVETRPAEFTEYAMAKVAGEILCAQLNSYESPGLVKVDRLPRLPTDQTNSMSEVETESALDVLLPLVRAVHAAKQFRKQRAHEP